MYFLKVSGRFISNLKAESFSMLIFTLNQEIIMTESFIPKFSLSSFFAELGGSLGLWLGVGALQLVSLLVSAASWINYQSIKKLMFFGTGKKMQNLV